MILGEQKILKLQTKNDLKYLFETFIHANMTELYFDVLPIEL